MKHYCHWPRCEKEVPPRLWGCREHWRSLPLNLRMFILRAYRPGQEVTKDPSPEYIEAAMRVRQWILRQVTSGMGRT